MNWYYAINGQLFGPLTAGDFNRKVGQGIIQPDTLVWREGMTGWQPWREVASGAGAFNQSTAAPFPGQAVSVAKDIPSLRFRFTGTWEGYFRVWIVNVLLTIVTLGIYAAWAKVRKKRWFYAHTSLAGHTFEYLAEPKRILVGNIIVVLVFALYSGSAAISPLVQLPIALVIMGFSPWFIARSYLFNARNSAWRGLRFGFQGRYRGAARVDLLLPLLVPFTLGLLLPYVSKERRKWMTENHAFGTTPFSFHGMTNDTVRIYLRSVLFFLPLIGGYVFLFVAMAVGGGKPVQVREFTSMLSIAPLLILAGMPFAYAGTIFLRARLFSYYWTHTMVGPHSFQAYMRARDLLGLQLINSLVVSLTLGLMWPWAAVRTVKFQLDHLEIIPSGDLDAFVARAQAPVGALGEAAGDFLDFDPGFGA
jgi:uncharacterized membrane protein YjgN (DUF898 family)